MTSGVEDTAGRCLPANRIRGWRGWLSVAAALAVIDLVLVLPGGQRVLSTADWLRIAVELPALMLALALLPVRARAVLRWAAVVALALLIFLKLADVAAFAAFSRPFNATVDLHLAGAGWNLLTGSLGLAPAALAITGILLAYGLAVLVVIWATGVAAGVVGGAGRPAGMASIALLAWFGALRVADPGGVLPFPLSDAGSRTAVGHAGRLIQGLADRSAFNAALARDALQAMPDDRLLAGLRGCDVLLVFVESYGRSALDDPRYAHTIGSTLDRFEAVLAERGAAAYSGWLTSPTVGGLSWLAHGTLLSGLWVDNQQRYDQLVASGRQTLMHAFGRAGWRTVGVMPAITMPWPEGRFFGYDRLYAAADLGYGGAPFNWVTMPDQYTLSVLQRREIEGRDRPPVMAEVALISSHAPWTPVAPVIPWHTIGDGAVFSRWASSGDPPEVVWRDADRVRDQYRLALDYTLQTLAAYAEAYLDERTLLVILGDHQPAPLITGDGATREVPVHIVAGNPALLAPLSTWNWSPGMMPDDNTPVWPMDAFRDRFLEAFTP